MAAAPKDFDTALRVMLANRCGPLIIEALRDASSKLSDHHRSILRLRYQSRAQVIEIARLFGVGPAIVNSQIDEIHRQLSENASADLARRLELSSEFLRQHLAEIIEYLDAADLIGALLE